VAGANPGMVIRVAADLSELRANLEEATGAIETTAGAMADMATKFSGDEIIAQAGAMVSAIEAIGGASALTAEEQATVNATVTEAIAKYTALGQTAPADMLALAAATKQVEEESSGVTTAMIAMGTTIGNLATEGLLALGGLALDGVKALGSAITEIVLTGSDVADIAGNFDHLTAATGTLGKTLLSDLREGTHGTITDFELMKTVNQNLTAGLVLTGAEYKTLAAGAFALAQTGSVEVSEALGMMTDAMLKGKPARLATILDVNELKGAEEAYALAHGTVVEKLTEGEKIEAGREAILRAVGEATDRLGEQTDGLDEKLAQIQTGWANFKDALGRAINDSGVLTAGLDALRESILAAFGGNEQAAIQTITKFINELAIKVVDAGLVFVEWGKTGASVFGLMKGPIDALTVAINYVITGFLDGLAKVYEAASKMPLVGDKFADTAGKLKVYADSWREVRDRTVEQMKADDEMWKGQSQVHTALNATTGVLVNMKAAMVAATLATAEAAPTVEAYNRTLASTEGDAERATAAQEKLNKEMAKWTEYERDHTKYGVEALGVFGNLERSLTPLPPVIKEAAAATEAFDSGLRFTAETIETAVVPAITSWSDAMEAVRKGQGSMAGSFASTSLVGTPKAEWSKKAAEAGGSIMYDDYNNPYIYIPGVNSSSGKTAKSYEYGGRTAGGWEELAGLASGGPVIGGRPYVVGEAGPELFVPGSSGSIVANGAGGASFAITVNTVAGDKYEIARVVKQALADEWRSYGGRV
jgi:hypothetical protein